VPEVGQKTENLSLFVSQEQLVSDAIIFTNYCIAQNFSKKYPYHPKED